MTDTNLITNNGNQATKGWGILIYAPQHLELFGFRTWYNLGRT